MMSARKRRRARTQSRPTLARRLGLAGVSILVTLLMAEVVLRVTDYGMISPELSFGVNARNALLRGEFVVDPKLFWKLSPKESPFDIAIKAVHPDRPVHPKGNLPRVLVLGDSCSRLTPQGLPYSASLQEMLLGKAEVLTAAVPGYSSWQGLAWLRSQLLATKPDIVIIYFGWNDHWRASRMEDRKYAASLVPWRPRLLLLLRRIPTLPPLRVPEKEYGQILEEMAQLVDASGGRPVFIRAPYGTNPNVRARLVSSGYLVATDDPVALHRAYLGVLDEAVAHAGALQVDAAGIFARLGSEPQLLMGDGTHLTPVGHRLMAALVAESIANEIPGWTGSGLPLEEVARQAVAALPD